MFDALVTILSLRLLCNVNKRWQWEAEVSGPVVRLLPLFSKKLRILVLTF